MKTLDDKYISVLEDFDWRVVDYTDDGCVDLEWYSPAGEDYIVTLGIDTFVEDFTAHANEFDIDEHIAGWIQAKHDGASDVPNARILVHDAEDIADCLDSIVMALHLVEEEGDTYISV